MGVKGTSLKSTINFIKDTYPNKLNFWLEKLPSESRKFFTDSIYATEWYPMQECLIIPTKITGKLFYSNNFEKASWDLGRYSAKKGLTGIYSIFIKVAKTGFVLRRSSRIFNTYYKNAEFIILKQDNNYVEFEVKGFLSKDKLILHRIAGWIEMVLELLGKKDIKITIDKSLVDENLKGKIFVKWDN